MEKPKICLCLTAETIAEDLALVEKYRNYVDIVELRVDFLSKDERLNIRHFPEIANIPAVLTIRRTSDGGKYQEGEAARTTLFARALAFADQDMRKNFAYIDLEEDYHVPSLQDAAFAFGTRIIRSYHNMTGTVPYLKQRMSKMMTTGYEIPKIAIMPSSLNDVTDMFHQAANITEFEHILVAMGPLGLPSRVLSQKLNSFLTYSTPLEMMDSVSNLGQVDPVTLNEVYHFREINEKTKLFGITGYPLVSTGSPAIHNSGYKKKNINALYIPVKAKKIEEALSFADEVDIQGYSVTVPHKESVLPYLTKVSEVVGEVGASNTIVKRGTEWIGYNTDAEGIIRALKEFLQENNLRRWKVAIIGAGGAAKAAAYAVKELRGRACIFNRTLSKARNLAEKYNFKYASLSVESEDLFEDYSDLIIQTTSIGLNVSEENFQDPNNDPIPFYQFYGRECVYDVIYHPEKTPFLTRAEKAGCKICNGETMLKYQAYKQFLNFTGVELEK